MLVQRTHCDAPADIRPSSCRRSTPLPVCAPSPPSHASQGGVSNADQAPRYKIHNGKLVLNYPDSSNPPTPNNASSSSSSTATSATASGLAANDLSSQIRPALKPTRSDGTSEWHTLTRLFTAASPSTSFAE